MPEISDYSFGKMRVGGKNFSADLIIFPTGKIMADWYRKNGHFLEQKDIENLLRLDPERIIIGTGASGRMAVDPKLIDFLSVRSIEYDIHPTRDAVDLYNGKITSGRNIGACFHLTC